VYSERKDYGKRSLREGRAAMIGDIVSLMKDVRNKDKSSGW
jgi:hypothetical protein